MGFVKKLLTCAAIGVLLSPYYIYSSNNTIGYSNTNNRPAWVQNIKQKQNLETKLKQKNEQVIMEEDYSTPIRTTIKTEKNYQVIESKDWLPLRALGYVGSLPFKAFMMSWDMNHYVKPETKKSIETLLENDDKIHGLTIRLNHTRPLKDSYRLFTEKQLTERNNFFARLLLGLPTTFLGEFFSKFTRCDYYNPYTKTAVVYSNIEAVAKHEIGHHRDFTRFDQDWAYSLARITPPVMLYQEWKASQYAKWTLEEKNRCQFGRYLIPAYGTYIASAMIALFKILTWARKKF
ncbi:MAG: hypothetical protein Q8N77_02700 [Nanoarchaeota archaeon]|nr:hypothetical protein [Nanoarchaeota archaeon]